MQLHRLSTARIASDAASQDEITSFKASDVVGSTLLGAANARAQERLQTLSLPSQETEAQAQAYANAWRLLRKKNSDERFKA